jgi:hypothetical protein
LAAISEIVELLRSCGLLRLAGDERAIAWMSRAPSPEASSLERRAHVARRHANPAVRADVSAAAKKHAPSSNAPPRSRKKPDHVST